MEWALLHHITLLPCIPHKHWSIGSMERYNRTLGDGITKQLYGKPHLNITYWGCAHEYCIMQHNFIGSIHAEPPISPYEQWYNEKPDLQKYPMLPFGSIVMAHIPLAKQAVGVPHLK